MNYRHAFHAGNHADVLKHWTLLFCLDRLRAKPAPFAVLDTHAGVGRYDLAGAEAERSPEWRLAALRVFEWDDAPPALTAYRDTLRAPNPEGRLRWLAGSPLLIAERLRAQDRLIACELHPADALALRGLLAKIPQAQSHHRDGYEAAVALTPFPERRGLVLIDPPYEDRDRDLARAAELVRALIRRFRAATIAWWHPLVDEARMARIDAALAAVKGEALRLDLEVDAPRGLSGSSMLVAHPPFGLEAAFAAAGPALAARLAQGPRAHAMARRFGAAAP